MFNQKKVDIKIHCIPYYCNSSEAELIESTTSTITNLHCLSYKQVYIWHPGESHLHCELCKFSSYYNRQVTSLVAINKRTD